MWSKYWMMIHESFEVFYELGQFYSLSLFSHRFAYLLVYRVSDAFGFHHKWENRQVLAEASRARSMEKETMINLHYRLHEDITY
jgi:hypothetical protein